MKKLYCRIDFHKNKSVVCVKDDPGKEGQLLELLSDNLLKFLSNMPKRLVGVEASCGVNHLILAECLRLNFIPKVYHKTASCRELKMLLMSREMLVRSRVNYYGV